MSPAMKKIIHYVFIALVAVSLSACSYFNREEVDVEKPSGSETINLMTGQTEMPKNNGVLYPGEYKDIAEAVRQSSDGRVEIFSLDDDFDTHQGMTSEGMSSGRGVAVEPVDAAPLHESSNHQRYPGVEIYPLDGDMALAFNNQGYNSYPSSPAMTPYPAADSRSIVASISTDPVVYFNRGSASLSQEDLMLISGLAGNYRGNSVSVAGHASTESSIEDPVQRKIVNLKLSMERAYNVAKALIESGIPAERIETRAYGETQPPAGSDRPIDVASRRVEISGISVQ